VTHTANIFAFLLWRTLLGAARRRLVRLREPRYLLGGIVGALYLYFWLARPLLHGGMRHPSPTAGLRLPPEALALILVLAAAGLALAASVFWLFHSGTPALHVSETEVQFLGPAPLPRRALLHLSLLRTELALLFSAVVAALFVGRAFVPHMWQAVVAAFMVFSTLQLHALGHTFWKARKGEATPATQRLMYAANVVAVLLGLAIVAWLVVGVRTAWGVLADSSGGPAALLPALAPWAAGSVPRILLAPFRAVLAPAVAGDTLQFLTALPAALAILAAHYLWVVRANVRYEEAALEGARRQAERRERRQSGRIHGLPSEAQRAVVPFPLPAVGRPEVAVLWKNLMTHRRARVGSMLTLWAAASALVLVASAGFTIVYPAALAPVLYLISFVCAAVALSLALVLPMASRNDFREDLERAAVLRAWPLAPHGLAAAELAAPLATSIGAEWALLSFGTAGLAGGRLALAWNGVGWSETSAGPVPTGWIAPALVSLAFLLPALSAAVLVVQNAAVLAFPAWFPPGGQRRGLEAMGTRLIAFAGTMLLLVFALIPAALAASLVGIVGWRFIGPWSLAPAAAVASLPVWAEVAVGITLLGRLFARFDVSAESWS
jgi:Putative ABC exporter